MKRNKFMNHLKLYEDYIKEEFSGGFFLLGFLIGLVLTPVYLQFGPHILRRIRIFFNKIKAVKSYRRQALEILNDLTEEQKSKLKQYIKHSAFAKWTTKETFFGIKPEINIGENDPYGEEDWGDDKKRDVVEIGTRTNRDVIKDRGYVGDVKFNGVAATGSEEEFFKEEKVKREKERFLNLFNGEQRVKVEKLINAIDDEFQDQVMRDTRAWGVKDPDMGMDRKPKLDLRPLDLEHTEDWWDRHNKVFNSRYDKWGSLKKEYRQ